MTHERQHHKQLSVLLVNTKVVFKCGFRGGGRRGGGGVIGLMTESYHFTTTTKGSGSHDCPDNM